MTKKEFIEAMKDLDDEAEISIFCSCSVTGIEGYSTDICFEDKVTGDDVMNELTIVAYF